MDLWIDTTDWCGDIDATADQRRLAAEAASQFMWSATARQFGLGVETVRPCLSRAGDSHRFDRGTNPTWRPLFGGCGCTRPDGCSCSRKSFVKLPRDRVTNIIMVVVDGVPLVYTDWALRGRNKLYRVSDTETWPCCQDLELEITEVGTWAVTYEHGQPVPPLLVLAAQTFGRELLKAVVDDPTCRIPKSAQVVNRQGITMQMTQFDAAGSTGLFEVDAAIQAVNPNRLETRATAWSPELAGKAVRDPVPPGSGS